MGLETATYITDLVTTNPVAGDFASQGDDHLRLIKSAIKNTFPNANRALRFNSGQASQASNYIINASTDENKTIVIDCRTANRTVTLPTAPADGFEVRVVKGDYSISTLTISGSAPVNGDGDGLVLYAPFQMASFVYHSAAAQWFAVVDRREEPGSLLFSLEDSVPKGYVFLNGQTIGNAASAATGRANADCLALFQVLWASFSNTLAPVLPSGRGASAIADFDANKTIRLPNACGRMLVARETMGGVAAVDLVTTAKSGINGALLGATGGSQETTLGGSNVPPHTHTFSATSSTDSHSHFIANTTSSLNSPSSSNLASTNYLVRGTDGGSVITYQLAGSVTPPTVGLTSQDTHNHTVNGTTGTGSGSAAAFGTMNPALVVNLAVKY
jgi:microcystin-dependent protein